MKALVGTIALAIVVSAAQPARAAGLPLKNQALLLLRTLAYDRNLSKRAEGTARIGVIYFSGEQSTGKQTADTLRTVSAGKTVSGLPIIIELISSDVVLSALKSKRFAALYLCDGIDSHMAMVIRAARTGKALTFTGSANQVALGTSVGLLERSGRAAIAINLPGSKAEGADLHSDLLRVAQVSR